MKFISKNPFHKFMTSSVVCLAAMYSVAPANADQKLYPGENGVRTGGATPSVWLGTLYNSSTTSWSYIDLPLVNDTSTDIESSSVTVVDRSSAANVSCALNSAYWNNGAGTIYGSWGSSKSTSGYGTTAQVLNTGALSGGERYFYFACSVPPVPAGGESSIIVSYKIDE